MKKFFRTIREQETKRRCSRCKEPAVAWIFRADKRSAMNKSSREALCRKHLAEERPNL